MIELRNYITDFDYHNSLYQYKRRQTREVNIGGVALGGNNPIRIQSMTTTDTLNTKATVEQSIRIIESACDYVRITAPSLKEAENLREIKKELRARGFNTPLIADIHFTPNAAELAARIVEKVRVNPGNYADKKKFQVIEYDDATYQAELDRIRQRFEPLVKVCKEYGTAMRIGTNHGSLSDRIMSRYGDTPVGMVESAMEFLRICEDNNYHEIVLSMKASNPIIMVEAYRLLVARMNREGMDYPLHLGVTEAGEGEDGRIKSAIGIGTLLEEGLGDTVRVSLTEEPEEEGPVAAKLVARYDNRTGHKPVKPILEVPIKLDAIKNIYSPFELNQRQTNEVGAVGGSNVPRVVVNFSGVEGFNELSLKAADYHYDAVTDKWNMGDTGADYIYLGNKEPGFMLPSGLKAVLNYGFWKNLYAKEQYIPLLTADEYSTADENILQKTHWVQATGNELGSSILNKLKADDKVVLVLKNITEHALQEFRVHLLELQQLDINVPVIIRKKFTNIGEEEFSLFSATDTGGLLADGFGNGIWLEFEQESNYNLLKSARLVNRVAFNILQAARARIFKTEYISCPSCGRTLFDLQETTAIIRQRTDHLKGVKIAIMGCIVNGPGEMADADYGYVGTGPGKITLYRGKEVVKRNIASNKALNELIKLIREDGNWVEKSEQVPVWN